MLSFFIETLDNLSPKSVKTSITKRILFITMAGALIFGLIFFPLIYFLFSSQYFYTFMKDVLFFTYNNPFISTITFLIMFLIISLIPILLTKILLEKEIINSLKNLQNLADEISMGNLDRSIKIDREDEIGKLEDSFERMRMSLKVILEKLEENI